MVALFLRASRWTALGFVIAATTGCPVQTWVKNYGGSGSEEGRAVVATSDGGYVFAGYSTTYTNGLRDGILVKVNAAGTKIWHANFGFAANERFFAVEQTNDGGYIAVGVTRTVGAGHNDIYIVKADASGDLQWQTSYGTAGADWGWAVRQTGDGGYIVAGDAGFSTDLETDADAYLIKLNEVGAQQWAMMYGGDEQDSAQDVQQTSDGGYVFAGFTASMGEGFRDYYLVKTDASGVEQWSMTYGDTLNDLAYGIVQTADGGYALGGETSNVETLTTNAMLVKTDANGVEQWRERYIDGNSSEAFSLAQTPDGGFVMAGRRNAGGGGVEFDTYIVKTDAMGMEEWSRWYGGSEREEAFDVEPAMDGGYIVAAYSESFGDDSQIYALKLDEEGLVDIPIFFPFFNRR